VLRAAGSLLLVAVLLSPVSAAEPPADDAEALIKEGLELRRQSQEQAALPYFQRAYLMVRTPRAAAQLGFAEQALGLWVEAENHLAEARVAETDPWIKEHRNLLAESAGFVRAHLANVELETNVTGATVLVDGKIVATTPLQHPLRVAIGQRRIELDAPTYRPAGRAVELTTGQTVRLALTLLPLTGGRAPLPPALELRAPAETAAPPRPLYRRWELWAGIGAAVIAAGVIVLATSGGPKPFPCGGADRVCAR
jgi:hypothetical protein